MKLKITHEDGFVLAELEGVIDEMAEDPFRESLIPLVRERGTKVVLDLSKAPRITSNGIAQLVLLVTNANTNNSRVILANIPTFIAGVLSVTKLDTFFELSESLTQAMDRLAVKA